MAHPVVGIQPKVLTWARQQSGYSINIEQLCNAVAAEILVPSDDFDVQIAGIQEFDNGVLEDWATRYWVSREVILRRLLDMDKIDRDEYVSKTLLWQAHARNSENKGSGGNYYAIQVAYL